MYFSVKKLIHHPRKRLYNLIKTCNIKKKKGKKKEKECRSHASFKEAEFNDKVEFLGASWAEDFVCLMEFPWEWPQNLSIRSQPCTFEAWLGFFDLLAISLFDVSSYLFSTRKIYTVKKNLSYRNPFSRRSFFHFYAQFRFIFEETSTVEMNVKIRQRLARVFYHIFAYKFFLFFLFITWNK